MLKAAGQGPRLVRGAGASNWGVSATRKQACFMHYSNWLDTWYPRPRLQSLNLPQHPHVATMKQPRALRGCDQAHEADIRRIGGGWGNAARGGGGRRTGPGAVGRLSGGG